MSPEKSQPVAGQTASPSHGKEGMKPLSHSHNALRLMAITAIAIFIAEGLVMFVLAHLPPLPPPVTGTLDAALLTAIILPALYKFFYQPLMRHVTERLAAEDKLLESQHRLERAQKTAKLGLWEYDIAKGEIILSSGTKLILGVAGESDKMTVDEYFSIIHPADRGVARLAIMDSLDYTKPINLDYRVKPANGEERVVHHYAENFYGKDGSLERMVGALKDITDRARANEDLARLAMAVEQADEAIVITDISGIIQYVNPAFERITGYARAEAIGQNPRILKSGKHDHQYYANMWKTISSGHVWRGHIINKNKAGELYEDEAVISPLLDKAGRIINYVAVKRDITREVELEKQVRHSQKMEAMGALAGGIAHDFNNILSSIIGYTEMAMDSIPERFEAQDDLREVLRAGRRARDLIKQILTFSRQSEKDMRPILPHMIIRESLKLIRASLPAKVSVREDIDVNSGVVLADPTQLNQVLLNLISNASHSMSAQGGEIKVVLAHREVKETMPAVAGLIRPGQYVTLCVSDMGHGISKEDMERIFEPFFTTKALGEGTGLGLAIVHGVITSHDGAITVESEPEKGSTFCVYLPRIEATAEIEVEMGGETPRGTETIMVVDDEEPVVKVLKRSLARLGYKVEAFTDPLAALDFFNSAPERFDLVITDHSMPKLSGLMMVERMVATRPDIPVVILTGASSVVSLEQANTLGIRGVINKPVTNAELASVVRRAMDGDSNISN
ncbi:MAG: PAS domain S-box protein [Nitrospinae bacterium]|nr:PAS domain S-box protein [Nitrospinota bacterium]